MPLQIQILRDAGGGFTPVGRALALAIDAAFTPSSAQILVPLLTGTLKARLTADAPAVVGYGTAADIGTAGANTTITSVIPGTPVEIGVVPGQRIGVRRSPGALDDSRQGTFTPTVTAATPPSSVAYTEQSGTFIKIGRLVFVVGRVVVSSFGSGGSGVAIIGGLPFSSAQVAITTQMRHSGAALPAGTILGGLFSGARLVLQAVGSQGSADVPLSSLNAGFDLIFSATYLT